MTVPLKGCLSAAPLARWLQWPMLTQKMPRLFLPPFQQPSPAWAPMAGHPPEKGICSGLEPAWPRTAHEIAGWVLAETPAFCSAVWEAQMHVQAIPVSHGSGRSFTPAQSAPDWGWAQHQSNRCDVRYAAAIINQSQLLFRYIHISFGQQHREHERAPLAHSQHDFIVMDEIKHNKAREYLQGRAWDLERIRVLFPALPQPSSVTRSESLHFYPVQWGFSLLFATPISLGKSLWQCAGI